MLELSKMMNLFLKLIGICPHEEWRHVLITEQIIDIKGNKTPQEEYRAYKMCKKCPRKERE